MNTIRNSRFCIIEEQRRCKEVCWDKSTGRFKCNLYNELLNFSGYPKRCEKCKKDDNILIMGRSKYQNDAKG